MSSKTPGQVEAAAAALRRAAGGQWVSVNDTDDDGTAIYPTHYQPLTMPPPAKGEPTP